MPDINVEIAECLAEGRAPTLTDIGGVQRVLRERDALATGPFADVLARWLTQALPEEESGLLTVMAEALARSEELPSFRSAVEHLSEPRHSARRLWLFEALLPLIAERSTPATALKAAYALEGCFVAASNDAQHHLLVGTLCCVRADDHRLFVDHASVLAAAAFRRWSDRAVLDTLTRLAAVPSFTGEPSVQYAYALAFAAAEADGVPRLDAASAVWRRVADQFTERTDAALAVAALDLCLTFYRTPKCDLSAPLAEVRRLATARSFEFALGRGPSWMAPAVSTELAWLDFARYVSTARDRIEEPAWLRGDLVAAKLAEAFGAQAFAALPPAARALVRTQIATRIAERENHNAVVRMALAELDPSSASAANASLLVAAVGDVQDREAPPRDEGAARTGEEQAYRDERIERLLQTLVADIPFDAFGTDGREHVLRTVRRCIRFVRSRLDDRHYGGGYLSNPDAVEGDLQNDLRMFLESSGDERVMCETSGIASGRTDLIVWCGEERLVIELKLWRSATDRVSAERHYPQAASYQATGITVALLGILEVNVKEPMLPTLNDCFWYARPVSAEHHEARHLVVFKVPGARRTPAER